VHFGDGQRQFGKPPKKLENRLGVTPRGFESHTLREKKLNDMFQLLFYFVTSFFFLKAQIGQIGGISAVF